MITQTLAQVFPGDPPQFLSRTPHGYHDVARIQADLSEAGFGVIDISTVTMTSAAPSPRDPATGYCQGTPLRAEIEARGNLEDATERSTRALADAFGSGKVEGKIQALMVSAR